MLKEIRFCPYKLQYVHHVTERDKETRLAFSTAVSGLIRENPDIVNKLLMTDEEYFHLYGFVFKQNMPYWSPVGPKEVREMPWHSPKVMVWCGVSVFGIVGTSLKMKMHTQ